ncbi:MAG TPA: DUF202 domain-containing protein [Croceibacterium sp.]
MAEKRSLPIRPDRLSNPPLDPIPSVDESDADTASVTYSHYRTGLSRHRTGLSEHRTDLSEYRTDLSGDRTELSMRRTGMSIQRTRMSADRTLMSVIRTSLSLIGFGFTVHEAFRKAFEAGAIESAESARRFGLALILIGILLLIGGIVRHLQFALELRRRRHEMVDDSLIHGQAAYPISVTLVSAMALLLLGVAAVVSMI